MLNIKEYFLLESIKAEEAIKLIASVIRGSKYDNKVFIAGGYVRDNLLGLRSKDVDLVVDGHGIEGGIKVATFIAKKLGIYKKDSNPVIFPRFRTAKLTLKLESGDIDVEFVAPRKEKYEQGSRKPIVSVGTIEDDAFRRDFTINALFKNLTTGEIFDLTGRSIKDLNKKVIQTTGNPDWIFSEDPLRILRAIRFAFKYNFDLPLSVIRSIKKNAEKLKNISSERIQDELNKILVLEKPSKAIRMFRITGILKYTIPELEKLHKLQQNKFHKHDAFKHTLNVLDAVPTELILRLSALFHDIGKSITRTEKDGKIQFIGHASVGSKIAAEIMKRLKYSNSDIEKVQKLINYHMDLKSAGPEGDQISDKSLRKFIYRVSDMLEPALKLIHADNISHADAHSMPKQIDKIRKRIEKMDINSILNTKSILDGNEIASLGAKGPLIGKIKKRILEKAIENPSLSKKQAIELALNVIRSSK
jgi:putative nucleotidyltransferase with HDIG domain